jgi:hypothetical protein
MRLFLIVIIFVFAVPAVISQTGNTPVCPKIEITGPSGPTRAGDRMVFTVNVTGVGSPKLKYNWYLSSGSIEEGPGTPTIAFQTTSNDAGSNITATVEIEGLPAGCPNTASETAGVVGCGHPSVFDEYKQISFWDEKKRLIRASTEMRGLPGAKLLFIFFRPKNASILADKKREASISKYLKSRGVRKDQLDFIYAERDSYLTRIYVLPAKC